MKYQVNLTHFPSDLRKSKDPEELISHHKALLQASSKADEIALTCANFLRGEQYTQGELLEFKAKRKTPVIFNKLKVFSRTLVGAFLQNKYDVKFSPVEPGDNQLSEVLEKIRIWQAGVCQDRKWVPEIVQRAYAMGRAYLECWMDVQPGKIPRMNSRLLPTLAVHWDPESRDLISRKDASFVDVDTWLSTDQLIDAFPEKRTAILQAGMNQTQGSGEFERPPTIEDYLHSPEYRNGRYRVVERYYKVRQKNYFSIVGDRRIEIQLEEVEDFREEYPNAQVYHEEGWQLCLATVVEGLDIKDYLYNGPYHCNPLDPTTGEVMWPIVELVAESLEGVPQGFVEPMIDSQKAFNAMMANIVHSAKHAASQAKLIDPKAFVTPAEAKKAAMYHSDADMAFEVNPGRTTDAMKPIEHAAVTADTYRGMEYSAHFMQEVSSTPPALQGIQESAATSGRLNQQRIEQSHVQLQTFISNFRTFLEVLYTLRYAYTRIYYTDEMVIRITEEGAQNSSSFLEVNKPVITSGSDGMSRLTILNDLDSMLFDITVEDSTRTPTYRAQMMQQLTEMTQSNAVANDPILGAAMFQQFVELSDMSLETKERIKEYNTLVYQHEVNKRALALQSLQLEQQIQQLGAAQQQQNLQTGEMQQHALMQQLAQTEAEQTLMGGVPPTEPADPGFPMLEESVA